MKKKLAIIGANESITVLINKAKELGYETHVFAWQCGDPGEEAADYFYPISIDKKDEILEKCREIGICGICSITSDFAAPTVSYVARKLGFPANPERTDLVARNKFQMRKAFREYGGIYTPKFIEADMSFDLADVADFRFPVIVKPTDRWSSKGITCVEKPEDLRDAVSVAVNESFDNKAIIEEYMEGPEYSAECIVYRGDARVLAITKKSTTGNPHYIEIGHCQPCDIPKAKQKEIIEIIKRALKALDITNGAAHAEFRILSDGNIGFMEIGARMGGGCIGTDLTPISTGMDYVRMVIDIACGNKPCFDIVTKPQPVSIKFIITEKDIEDFKRIDPARIIRRSEFDENFDKEVTDGSTRHGYYIMKSLPPKEELKGKRLIVLGGNLWLSAIKEYCESNEIKIIAVGNNPNSKLNAIAEEYYNVNSTDAEAMKKLIKEKNIDGVYMGGTESVIGVACQYINELGLPCYCNKAQWDALQNKKNFKDVCVEVGLPVVPKYDVKEDKCSLSEEVFPVITKPADGSGSKGFSVCRNNDELKTGYETAKQSSPTGTVITEKFVKNSGVVCFYTIGDGIIHFSGLSDKYPVKFQKQGSYVGGLFVYESGYEKEFRDKYEQKIQNLVTKLGIKEGPLWIEVFRDDGSYYFNEVGFRYGGSVSVYSIDYMLGINQVASDIYFALTGRSKLSGHQTMIPQNVPPKSHYAVYPVYVSAGKIGEVHGVNELKNDGNIVTIIEKLGAGNTIIDTGSFGQVFALIHFVFDDKAELYEMLDKITKTIRIFSEQNEDMVLKMLDTENLNFKSID